MPKKDRISMVGKLGRGADAFFAQTAGKEEDVLPGNLEASIPVKQEDAIPVQQSTTLTESQVTSTTARQPSSNPVKQETGITGNQEIGKPVFMKATYYITVEQDLKLEQIRLTRRRHGERVDKSALIREAIDLLADQEAGKPVKG